jgi:hypothetical protein
MGFDVTAAWLVTGLPQAQPSYHLIHVYVKQPRSACRAIHPKRHAPVVLSWPMLRLLLACGCYLPADSAHHPEDLVLCVAPEGRQAAEQDVQDDSQGPHVSLVTVVLAQHLSSQHHSTVYQL